MAASVLLRDLFVLVELGGHMSYTRSWEEGVHVLFCPSCGGGILMYFHCSVGSRVTFHQNVCVCGGGVAAVQYVSGGFGLLFLGPGLKKATECRSVLNSHQTRSFEMKHFVSV